MEGLANLSAFVVCFIIASELTDILYRMYPGDYWRKTNLIGAFGIWTIAIIFFLKAVSVVGEVAHAYVSVYSAGIWVAFFGVKGIINLYRLITLQPNQAIVRIYPDGATMYADGSIAVNKIVVVKWGHDFAFKDLFATWGEKQSVWLKADQSGFSYYRNLLIQQEKPGSPWFHITSKRS